MVCVLFSAKGGHESIVATCSLRGDCLDDHSAGLFVTFNVAIHHNSMSAASRSKPLSK